MPYKDKEQELEKVRRHRRRHLKQYAKKQAEYYNKNVPKYLYIVCKGRAKRSGIPFNLTEEDFAVPKACPVLGIPIFRSNKFFQDHSPSVDRLIPSLGYVKGNVEIISFRANRMKYNASLEEVEALAKWMRNRCEVSKPVAHC